MSSAWLWINSTVSVHGNECVMIPTVPGGALFLPARCLKTGTCPQDSPRRVLCPCRRSQITTTLAILTPVCVSTHALLQLPTDGLKSIFQENLFSGFQVLFCVFPQIDMHQTGQ